MSDFGDIDELDDLPEPEKKPRQFVACSWSPEPGARTYTYHNDSGEPLAVGDWCEVEARGGKMRKVKVQEIDVPKPTQFETKPAVKLPPREEDEDAAKAVQ